MLAGILYPYDDDAPAEIGNWIMELTRERCIVLYQVDGQSYIEIQNFLKHQKIDHKSRSKFPSPPFLAHLREDARGCEEGFPDAREDSPLDQGSRIKDQGREGSARASPAVSRLWAESAAEASGIHEAALPVPLELDEELGEDPQAAAAIAHYFANWRHFWFAVRKGDMKKPEHRRAPDFSVRSFLAHYQDVLIDMGVSKRSQERAGPWTSGEHIPVPSAEERASAGNLLEQLAARLTQGGQKP
jgi:hypothetical protein